MWSSSADAEGLPCRPSRDRPPRRRSCSSGAAVRANRGDCRPLASALLAFDSAASPIVVGIAPERVDNLLGDQLAWQLPLALIASALMILTALGVVAVRVAEASAHRQVDLPLLLANACMLGMAVVPLAAGAAMLLGAKQLVRRASRQPDRSQCPPSQ